MADVGEAQEILETLGMPPAQHNQMARMTLIALRSDIGQLAHFQGAELVVHAENSGIVAGGGGRDKLYVVNRNV